MADAWLGRIAAGDDELSTLQELYAYGARLHRETNRLGVQLDSRDQGRAVSIHLGDRVVACGAGAVKRAYRRRPVRESPSATGRSGLCWTAGRITSGSSTCGQIPMFAATQRWPDVISVAATILPPQAIIMSAVTAATNALAAHAAATLDKDMSRWEWADRVDLRAGLEGSTEARRHQLTDTVVAAIDPNQFPLIAADLAYVRGMAHRQLDEEDKAQVWLSKATINGALIEQAKEALADPRQRLAVTDEETINTRTNKWDVSTERSEQQRRDEKNEKSAGGAAGGRAVPCSTTRLG